LFRAFLDAGLPPNAAALLTGQGADVGAYLVNSPHVAAIAFTAQRKSACES